MLGCNAIYADNYNPDATINDGSCNYDIADLLSQGYCIGELLNGGVLWQDFRGIPYQGGVIVHVNESEGKALICDDEDLPGTYSWGCSNESVSGTTCGAYNGLSNTQEIVTNGCINEPSAAQAAYLSTKDGYVDWFLPTGTEMAYAEACPGWNEGFSSCTSYWTSRQVSSSQAYVIRDGTTSYSCFTDYFSTGCGYYNYASKSSQYKVRMMRYVDISQNCLEQGICGDWQYNGEQLQPENAGVGCSYELFSCSAIGDGVWNQIVAGIYPASTTSLQYGLGWERDLILNIPTTYPLDGNDYEIVDYTITGIDGIPTGISSGLQVNDVLGQNGQLCCSLSGTALEEGTFTLTVTGTLQLSILGNILTVPDVQLYHTIDVVPNTDGIPGCIYSFAGNYNPIATYDDGTCSPGDGSCPGDFDGDGLVGVIDILFMLGLFNNSCD